MPDKQENAIEFFTNDKRVTVTFSQGRFKTKIRKLAEMYPDEVQILADKDNDGYLYAHIPVSYIRIQRPREVILTDEQRQALVERLRLMREKHGKQMEAENDLAVLSTEDLVDEIEDEELDTESSVQDDYAEEDVAGEITGGYDGIEGEDNGSNII